MNELAHVAVREPTRQETDEAGFGCGYFAAIPKKLPKIGGASLPPNA